MQALRRLFGVQSSPDFHDHGLRLLVPDVSDTEELQSRRDFESVSFLIASTLYRSVTDMLGHTASSLSMD